MLICPAIGDTDPIRCANPSPDSQFSGNILDEAMRGATFDADPVGRPMSVHSKTINGEVRFDQENKIATRYRLLRGCFIRGVSNVVTRSAE